METDIHVYDPDRERSTTCLSPRNLTPPPQEKTLEQHYMDHLHAHGTSRPLNRLKLPRTAVRQHVNVIPFPAALYGANRSYILPRYVEITKSISRDLPMRRRNDIDPRCNDPNLQRSPEPVDRSRVTFHLHVRALHQMEILSYTDHFYRELNWTARDPSP